MTDRLADAQQLGLLDHQRAALQFAWSTPSDLKTRNRALSHLRRWGRGGGVALTGSELLTMNFHPDRVVSDGRSVLASIHDDGLLRNRFEAMVTAGFTHPSRVDACLAQEETLFGGAYHGALPSTRPKFAGVNIGRNPRGAWPRFGSCHWVLDDAIRDRSSVTIPGSHQLRAWWGSFAALEELGLGLGGELAGLPDGHRFRATDGAVEVQVHGELRLDRDVVALVLDPSYSGTSVHRTARSLSDRYGVEIRWAPPLSGRLDPDKVSARRAYAKQRLIAARAFDIEVMAAWIGSEDPTVAVGEDVVDGVRRFLWNRLLLMCETHPTLPDGHSIGNWLGSSVESGRRR